MKRIAPDYYPQFRCIAGACRHNCCIGWEIDVDEDTLAYYQSLDGTLGEKLQRCICLTEETPHFILTEGERCPFLNENNLCELILEKGEAALCQICDDHPRFYNDFSAHVEMGVGLSCEAAGRLLLSRTEKTQLVCLEAGDGAPDAQEAALLALRQQLFDAAQDRSLAIDVRMEQVLRLCGAALPDVSMRDWARIYRQLEQLDPAWQVRLEQLQDGEIAWPGQEWDTAFEQLLHYFLYRHLPGALEDGCVPERAAFAVLSVRMIRALCGCVPQLRMEDIVEISRMYSAEIEYSDENVEALLQALMQA